jgi:hypothetical protein
MTHRAGAANFAKIAPSGVNFSANPALVQMPIAKDKSPDPRDENTMVNVLKKANESISGSRTG